MTPLGLLGPLAPEWFKDNKVLGCPHPHIPSGKEFFFMVRLLQFHIYFVFVLRSFSVVSGI